MNFCFFFLFQFNISFILIQKFCSEELQWFLTEADTPKDAYVAHLIAKHPQKGGTWKEVFVFRHSKIVQCYRMESLARRWYRRLEYTTDQRMCMQVSANIFLFFSFVRL